VIRHRAPSYTLIHHPNCMLEPPPNRQIETVLSFAQSENLDGSDLSRPNSVPSNLRLSHDSIFHGFFVTT
jgi:hypothetical protein